MEFHWTDYILHVLLQVCFVTSIIHRNSDQITVNGKDVANVKQIRWANSAFNYVNNLNCNETFFTSERECQRLITLSKSDVNVYIADPTRHGRLRTVVPEDDLDHNDVHDAVLVLDPYPQFNLGHLVLVFYIDIYAPKTWCDKDNGLLLRE